MEGSTLSLLLYLAGGGARQREQSRHLLRVHAARSERQRWATASVAPQQLDSVLGQLRRWCAASRAHLPGERQG